MGKKFWNWNAKTQTIILHKSKRLYWKYHKEVTQNTKYRRKQRIICKRQTRKQEDVKKEEETTAIKF